MNYTNLPNFYTHTVSYAQNSILSIDQIGRDVSKSGFSYPHYNNTYIISVVRKGKGTLEIEGKKYNLSQNDAFLTLPNSLSIQTADEVDPWELCFISFEGSAAKSIVEKTVFKSNTTIINLKNDDLAEEIIKSAIALNNETHSDFTLLEFFFKLISHLDPQKAAPYTENETTQNKYVSEIKRYIHSNYPETIKIAEIASTLNINRSHLYRIFKAEVGVGVEDYIINIRMTHAKVLLKDTFLSVSAVASITGYKNYTTFFKRFRQVTGLTPNEYRNAQTNA